MTGAGMLAGLAVLLVGLRCAPARSRRLLHAAAMGDAAATGDDADVPGAHLLRRAPAVLVGGLAAAVGVTLVGPVPVLAAVSAVLLARRVRRDRCERRRQRNAAAALPDTVDLLVLLLHAGSTPTQAVREIVDLAPDPMVPAVREVVHRLDRGQGLADALDALPDLVGPAARPLADGIASAERYGLPLAPVLTRLADDARAARRRQAEAHARTLSVRLSFPLVCCTLPAFVLLAVVPALVGALSSLGDLGP